MLKQSKYVLGVYLLLLVQTVQNFVLLTANIEDVKKLARKFVSEHIAEKIGDFIAKASLKIADEAVEVKTLNNSKVSEENQNYNKIVRHVFDNQSSISKKPKTTKRTSNRESFELTTMKDDFNVIQEKKHKQLNKSDYSHSIYVNSPKLDAKKKNHKKTEITIKTKQRKRTKQQYRNRVDSEEGNETITGNDSNGNDTITTSTNNIEDDVKINAFNMPPLDPVKVNTETSDNVTKTKGNETLYDSKETNPAPDLDYDKYEYKDIANQIPGATKKQAKFFRANENDGDSAEELPQMQMTVDWWDKELPKPDSGDSRSWF